MNRDLTLLVNPDTWAIPRLLKKARQEYHDLLEHCNDNSERLTLNEYTTQSTNVRNFVKSMSSHTMKSFSSTSQVSSRRKKHTRQKQWVEGASGETGREEQVKNLLHIHRTRSVGNSSI